MLRRLFAAALVLVLGLTGCRHLNPDSDPLRAGVLPGVKKDGRILLSNGWWLSPAGQHIDLGQLPLGIDTTPDERYAAVANSGYRQDAFIVDLVSRRVVDTLKTERTWLGVRFFDNGRQLAVSGGHGNRVLLYDFNGGRATFRDSLSLGRWYPKDQVLVAGLDVSPDNRTLYTVGVYDSTLFAIDLTSKQVRYRLLLGATPYTVRVHPTRDELYVTLWDSKEVGIYRPADGSLIAKVATGDHPNAIALSKDGQRLFVANANQNSVSVIDLDSRRIVETIITSIAPDAPPGSTPNALAVSPDGEHLYVANADNNFLAVFEIEEPGRTRSLGFIPTGWYPTAVHVQKDGTLLVVNGKGSAGSRANPKGPKPMGPKESLDQYSGSMFKGSLSFIPPVDEEKLEEYTLQAAANTPYVNSQNKNLLAAATPDNPILTKNGSPIKHVFYIIKENRTYDQVLGDLKEGNGDPSLCLFPEKITPNHHALARQFVLLDNLYNNAEVSADGHEWSMGAYASDFVEKNWPANYGNRGGRFPAEGSYGPISEPNSGYIWDVCIRNGVSVRSYGEFVEYFIAGRKDTVRASVDGLIGHVAENFPPFDMAIYDTTRTRLWMKEFDRYDREGGLPQLSIIRLPDDHTSGTAKGQRTPLAMVADNDLALGQMVDRISRSRYWKESAIFVIEDDAQNGSDHVDAHRMPTLVISPYTKRNYRDRNLYTTASVLRTMELILGLPPMSQYDASALPLFASFTSQANLSPYKHLPANIDLTELNKDGSYKQEKVGQMNLSVEDAIPDVEFNEIIWKAIRGEDSEMPAPVRSAFVFAREEDEDED